MPGDRPDTTSAIRPARHRRSRGRRAVVGVAAGKFLAAAVALVLVLAAVDVVVLSARVDHLTITSPTGAPGETWVIVGSDSRADIPVGASQSTFGSVEQVAGSRADIVLVVHRAPDGAVSTLSVPRDLVLHNRSGELNRLALTFQVGPQDMIDSLCTTLGIPTDHLVVVDFAVFTAVVDDLGGVVVDLPTPLRDASSGLDLRSAGVRRLDGSQALALVRSRHTQELVGGRWTAIADGAQQRTSWGGLIFRAVVVAASATRNPLLLQRLSWTVSGAVQMDQRTSIADLGVLAQSTGSVVDLPATPQRSGLGLSASDGTYAALSSAGYDRSCQ